MLTSLPSYTNLIFRRNESHVCLILSQNFPKRDTRKLNWVTKKKFIFHLFFISLLLSQVIMGIVIIQICSLLQASHSWNVYENGRAFNSPLRKCGKSERWKFQMWQSGKLHKILLQFRNRRRLLWKACGKVQNVQKLDALCWWWYYA